MSALSGGIAPSDDANHAQARALDKMPLLGSLLLGFVASLCCGGGLIFGAIGLGAAYSALQISRFIPQALAGGAVLIILLNWLYYRRKAVTLAASADGDSGRLRRAAVLSGLFGLAIMAGSFVFLEWLNHGVVHAGHFMHNPEYATAVIPGVPNSHLEYVAMTFLALPVLAILPLRARAR